MTQWTVAHQSPLPMEFSRKEYWVAISFCRRSSQPRDQTHISYISSGFFESPGKPQLYVRYLLLFSHSAVSNSLQPHGLQDARLLCLSPSSGACSNSCLLSWWCHPTISSSVIPFSSYFQSCQASGSFPISRFFTSGGQSIGISDLASVPSMNTQDWFSLGLTGLTSLQSKRLSRVFSNTIVQ